jgi:hypothetical protein
MKLADQRRQHMAVVQIEIVARPIEIGRHHAAEVGSVRTVVGLAQLDPGDLGDGVRLVGRLQQTREQG